VSDVDEVNPNCVISALIGPPAGGKSEIARCTFPTIHNRMSCSEDIRHSALGRAVAPESNSSS